mmetsp:Transcript_35259/g.81633  ORF Transcript_35259/g.81633 Transcript_35259/m.81633 type:complete len:237 (+) Transcript_35259:482-1192(+)
MTVLLSGNRYEMDAASVGCGIGNLFSGEDVRRGGPFQSEPFGMEHVVRRKVLLHVQLGEGLRRGPFAVGRVLRRKVCTYSVIRPRALVRRLRSSADGFFIFRPAPPGIDVLPGVLFRPGYLGVGRVLRPRLRKSSRRRTLVFYGNVRPLVTVASFGVRFVSGLYVLSGDLFQPRSFEVERGVRSRLSWHVRRCHVIRSGYIGLGRLVGCKVYEDDVRRDVLQPRHFPMGRVRGSRI